MSFCYKSLYYETKGLNFKFFALKLSYQSELIFAFFFDERNSCDEKIFQQEIQHSWGYKGGWWGGGGGGVIGKFKNWRAGRRAWGIIKNFQRRKNYNRIFQDKSKTTVVKFQNLN